MEIVVALGVLVLVVVFWAIAKSVEDDTGSIPDNWDRRPVIRPNTSHRSFSKPKKPTPNQTAEAWCRDNNVPLPPMPASLTLTGAAYVIDGDTIRVKKTKIRISGIDAPELNMPWGQKSKWTMVKICKGKQITVKLDGERSFDRLVGTCFLPDGSDIGAEIVKEGLALDLPAFSAGKYRCFEPEGARRKLANGAFGHRSLKRAGTGT